MATRQSDSANSLMICLVVSTQYRRVTDRQTSNRQTFCDMIVCDSCTTLNRELSGCYVVYLYRRASCLYYTVQDRNSTLPAKVVHTAFIRLLHGGPTPPPLYFFLLIVVLYLFTFTNNIACLPCELKFCPTYISKPKPN